jgi:GrpB-like predicted nucleotidyltransferase (UPF0157 family)
LPTLVELFPYDPNWEQHFFAAEAALRMVLGSCVVSIDHIGSTAISGMAAKPVIDIDITVSSLAAIPNASANLVNQGYEARGNRYDDDVWAFILKAGMPQFRVYLCPPENNTHLRRMLFRNFLRQNEAAATEYMSLKTRLAEQFPYDGDRYTSEKSQFVQEIVNRALEDLGVTRDYAPSSRT